MANVPEYVNTVIENIVRVTAVTNKWMMWCESNSPDKAVFVPTVFQMRDAYSHIIQLFGKGFETGKISTESCDFNQLFHEEYSVKQLEEAFTHATRAFYDCADYILLVIKQDVVQCEENYGPRFVDLRSKLLEHDGYITELRSAKSEDMEGNCENIRKWNLFLQLITSAYVFADFDIELLKIISEIETKLNMIETKFSQEIIKNHDPQFYQNKTKLIELSTRPVELEKYLKDDSVVSEQLLENSQEWCENIVKELSDKIRAAEQYSASLDALQKVMANSNIIQKRRGFFKTGWGFVSTGLSWILTNLLSSQFMTKQVMNSEGQLQTTTVDKLNLQFLIPFLIGTVLIFGLGVGVFKIISKWHKK